MPESRVISVLIGDDHPVVVGGLSRFIAALDDIRVLASASRFEEVLERTRDEAPDVVVLDLGMPGMQGTQSIRALGALAKAPGVVVFSMQPEDRSALDLLRAGACAFLNKGRAPEEVAEAIRRAARGQRYLTDTLSECALATADAVDAHARHEALSPREWAVFRALVSGQSAKEVAFDLGIRTSSVHTYTERIKRKLEAGSVVELVAYAHRHGLVQ